MASYRNNPQPSMAFVERWLNEEHDVPLRSVKDKISDRFAVEIGDFNDNTESWEIYRHSGGSYPEKFVLDRSEVPAASLRGNKPPTSSVDEGPGF